MYLSLAAHTTNCIRIMTKKKEKLNKKLLLYLCDSAGIQTRNLLIRSQMLYSVELQSHAFRKRLQRYHFILILANILATFYFFIAALPLYALFKPATTSFVISLRLSA